jgi:hypothetical protein
MSSVDAVRAALAAPDAASSEQQVHEIIAAQLQILTSDSEVLVTGYFNHSWVPDFLIRSGQGEQRGVYLRFDIEDPGFTDDLHYLAAARPVFIDLLSASASAGDIPGGALRDPLTGVEGEDVNGVLVIGISAVARLAERVVREDSLRRASHELIVGGHGLVDEQTADAIIENWEAVGVQTRSDRPAAYADAFIDLARYMRAAAALPVGQPLLEAQTLSRTVDPFTPDQQWVARLVQPTSFRDAQTIADALKNATPVVMDVQNTPRDVARRLIDFASGLAYALDGEVGRMADEVFLFVPQGTARLARRVGRRTETPSYVSPALQPRRQGSR